MTTVKLYCTGAMARATVDGPLTHGMVGVPVEVEWDTPWDGLLKTLKFRCGDVSRTALVDGDSPVTVPHECLISGQWLEIGLDGWDADGNLRIPSSWASCGMVKPSVAQVDAPEGAPPTPDTIAQLQILVNKAETAAGELAGAADAAASSANAAKDALDKTTAIAASTPYIGENGNWFVWDADHGSYVDSGIVAVGPQGPIGPSGLTGPQGDTGPQGPQGVPGKDGSDANVTVENIGKALGFTPANAEDVNQIKDDLAYLAPAGAAVGQLFRVAAISEDGKYTMEPVDMPQGGGDGWELINAIDIDTAVTGFKIDKTADGQTFECDEMLIFLFPKTCEGNVNAYLNFITENGNVNGSFIELYTAKSINEIHIKKENGYLFAYRFSTINYLSKIFSYIPAEKLKGVYTFGYANSTFTGNIVVYGKGVRIV